MLGAVVQRNVGRAATFSWSANGSGHDHEAQAGLESTFDMGAVPSGVDSLTGSNPTLKFVDAPSPAEVDEFREFADVLRRRGSDSVERRLGFSRGSTKVGALAVDRKVLLVGSCYRSGREGCWRSLGHAPGRAMQQPVVNPCQGLR